MILKMVGDHHGSLFQEKSHQKYGAFSSIVNFVILRILRLFFLILNKIKKKIPSKFIFQDFTLKIFFLFYKYLTI